MSLKKTFYYFCRVVCIIFLFIGVSVSTIAIHEFKHYIDIKDNSQVTEICVLNIPSGLDGKMGYVTAIGDVHSSEFIAHIYSFVFIIISAIIVAKGFPKREMESDVDANT